MDSVRVYNDSGELVRIQTRDQHTDAQNDSHMIQNHTDNAIIAQSHSDPSTCESPHKVVNSMESTSQTLPHTEASLSEANCTCICTPETMDVDHAPSMLMLTHNVHVQTSEADEISDGENEGIIDIRESCEATPMEQQVTTDTPKQLYSPQTQLGKQVTELISDNQLTKKFDKLRSALKSGDTSGRQRTRQRYERTAKKVKEILIAQLKECIQLISEWEQTFVATHGTLPNPKDIPEITATAMKRKRRLSNTLYHEWKLTLTDCVT